MSYVFAVLYILISTCATSYRGIHLQTHYPSLAVNKFAVKSFEMKPLVNSPKPYEFERKVVWYNSIDTCMLGLSMNW